MAASKPVLFVELVDKGGDEVEFRLTEEGREVIEAIGHKKISIVTIAGPQRTGKSFLANRLLNRMNGFAIGPTVQPCTKGIWIWSQPIIMKDSETAVVIMDTEGLFSVYRNDTVDCKILALSLLLSTVLVYNSFGHIDEAAIERIGLVTRLVEMIRIDKPDQAQTGGDAQNKKESAYKDLAAYFPYFLWCLRDFTLDLQKFSSDQYLEDCLKEVEPKDQTAMNKNKTRKHIKTLLKDRNCLTFVRPIMGQEHKLTRIEELSYDELRPEFRDTVTRFLQLVQQNLKPKLVAGKGITGKMFVQLTNEYLKAFNTGGCPEILPALEIVIQREANSIQEEKTKLYMEAWNMKLKELVNAKDAKEVLPSFNALVAKLDSDLWSLATKRQNYDLFWIPREKIVKELRLRLDMFLEEMGERKKNLSSKVKTKFAESLVPPSKAPLTDYFSVPKIKEFHKGMIGWLDKALARESGPNTPNIGADLVSAVCDYYEKFIETGNVVIQLELEQRQDQLEIAKCSEEELTRILQDQQKYAESLRDKILLLQNRVERQDRELSHFKDSTQDSSTLLSSRIRALEMEIEDLRNERDKANSEVKKLASAHDGYSMSKGSLASKTTAIENDGASELLNIEGKIDQLKKVGDGDDSFFTIFEAYKAAVNNELTKYKKNISLLRKENDSLKSNAVDVRKKEELIEKLKRKIEESEDDQSISSLSTRLKQKEEEYVGLSVQTKFLQAGRMNWIEMYRETVKKLKKKTNNFENAFNMLSEEDQQEVDAVLKEVGVKL